MLEHAVDTVRGAIRRRRLQRRGSEPLRFGPPQQPRVVARDPAAALNFFRLPGSVHKSAEAAPAPTTIDDVAWYHTIELPDGRVTPGLFDHRALVPRYGLPVSLAGRRVLDVATFNGFWAFEMERRGADKVTAVDLDKASQIDIPQPARVQLEREKVDAEIGQGFALAKEALGSHVERVVSSVYDLDASKLGTFDFVHVADLLVHLRSPIAALTAIRSVCSGELLISDGYDPRLSRPHRHLVEYLGGWDDAVWWLPSLDTFAQMVVDAGFRDVRLHTTYNLARRGEPEGIWRAVLRARA